MGKTFNLNTNIQLTINQLVDLAKQLPQKDRLKIASMLLDEESTFSKEELKAKIKEGLEEINLHKKGQVKLRTLSDFLADV